MPHTLKTRYALLALGAIGCFSINEAQATLVSVDFGNAGDAVATAAGPAGGAGEWLHYTTATSVPLNVGGGVTVLLNEYGSGGLGTPSVNHTFTNTPLIGNPGLEDTNPPGSGFFGNDTIYGEVFFDRDNTTGIALLISGLPAGTHDFYTIGIEQNQRSRDYNSNIQAGTGLTFNSTAGDDATVDPSGVSSFVDGGSYVLQTLTVEAGENVAIFYNSTNNDFTSIAGLQINIAAIPEPALTGAWAAGSVLCLVRRRRTRA